MSSPFSLSVGERHYSGRTNLGAEFSPAAGAPLVIALHGGTYSSQYFDISGYSLLDRATTAGVPVIAIDRPNYGDSTELQSAGSIIFDNAEVLSAAIGSIWAEYGAGRPGVVLVGHSIGGGIATAIAASTPAWPLIGLATSGCLVRVPMESAEAWAQLPPIPMIELPVPLKDQLMFGPAGTFSADMPAQSHPSNTAVPKAELLDITGGWLEKREETTARVTVPVHHRQGEFDNLWITSQREIDEYAAGFTAAASVDAALQRGSGHCIDFHLPSGEFQASQLAFAARCAAAVNA